MLGAVLVPNHRYISLLQEKYNYLKNQCFGWKRKKKGNGWAMEKKLPNVYKAQMFSDKSIWKLLIKKKRGWNYSYFKVIYSKYYKHFINTIISNLAYFDTKGTLSNQNWQFSHLYINQLLSACKKIKKYNFLSGENVFKNSLKSRIL